MKKKQSDNFIIPYVVYPFELLVSLGESDKQFKKVIKRLKVDLEGDNIGKFKNSTVEGTTLFLNTNQTILRMKHYSTTNEHFATLAHEIFHCVDLLFNQINIRLSSKSDEAYAYMISYITLEIYKQINNQN